MKIFLRLSEPKFERQIKNVINAFFLSATYVQGETQRHDLAIFVDYEKDGLTVRLQNESVCLRTEKLFSPNALRWHIQTEQAVYEVISKAYGRRLNWGILTGVRPVKIASKWLQEGKSNEETEKEYTDERYVSKVKAQLCLALAEKENVCLQGAAKDAMALYVHVPICPHRCGYCSFISKESNDTAYIEQYYQALMQEIRAMGEYFSKKRTVIDSLYVGGGTPSIFDATMIEALLAQIRAHFDVSRLREATFEAGRADCITEEKLSAMQAGGIGRICINAQSMHNTTLKAMGRNLTKEEFLSAFAKAKKYPFNINVDLIYGLEGESEEMFYASLQEVAALEPDNITLHTLSYKRKAQDFDHKTESAQERLAGFDDAYVQLAKKGYAPYYLYRQKHNVSGGENTGFCKKDKESIYNISVISDRMGIIGLGAGAVGKIRDTTTGKIKRIDGYYDMDLYMQRICEVIDKKAKAYETIE